MVPAENLPADNLPEALMHIEVLFCPAPHVADLTRLQLTTGATVADALLASGLQARHGSVIAGQRVGIWNKIKESDTPLRDGDRVEVYLPLRVDPKEARRQRYQQHRDSLAARASKGKAPKPGG